MNYSLSDLEQLLGRGVSNYQAPLSSDLEQFSQSAINAYCFKYGLSLLPTRQLLRFLSQSFATNVRIADIGCGAALLSRLLTTHQFVNVDPGYDSVVLNRIDGVSPIPYASSVIDKTDKEFFKTLSQHNRIFASIVAFVPWYPRVIGPSVDLSVIFEGTQSSVILIYDNQQEQFTEQLLDSRNEFTYSFINTKIFGRGSGNFSLLKIVKGGLIPIVQEDDQSVRTQQAYEQLVRRLEDSQQRQNQVLYEAMESISKSAEKNLEAAELQKSSAELHRGSAQLILQSSANDVQRSEIELQAANKNLEAAQSNISASTKNLQAADKNYQASTKNVEAADKNFQAAERTSTIDDQSSRVSTIEDLTEQETQQDNEQDSRE